MLADNWERQPRVVFVGSLGRVVTHRLLTTGAGRVRPRVTVAATALLVALSIAPTPTPTVVWSEEFSSGLGLFRDDSAVWFVGNDSQFLPSQHSVANGMLTLTASRQTTPSGKPYAAGIVSTRTTFNRAGGYVEARIWYDAGTGLWPAFWLYSASGGVPELDVMEAYPNLTAWPGPFRYQTTIHYSGGQQGATIEVGQDLTTGWHTFGMDWRPGSKVDFYLDGRLVSSFTSGVASTPMYVLLDLAVGNWTARADATTPDTARMRVDYVRWWNAKP